MYCIQQMVTTGQTSMNHIPLPEPARPVADPFYCHPYGGIARDIHVNREGFKRFFEIDDFLMSQWEVYSKIWGFSGKVFDVIGDWDECLGYIGTERGVLKYMITIIVHDHSRVSTLLDQHPHLWGGNNAVRNSVQNSQN